MASPTRMRSLELAAATLRGPWLVISAVVPSLLTSRMPVPSWMNSQMTPSVSSWRSSRVE